MTGSSADPPGDGKGSKLLYVWIAAVRRVSGLQYMSGAFVRIFMDGCEGDSEEEKRIL